jgi:hypothetical protein
LLSSFAADRVDTRGALFDPTDVQRGRPKVHLIPAAVVGCHPFGGGGSLKTNDGKDHGVCGFDNPIDLLAHLTE